MSRELLVRLKADTRFGFVDLPHRTVKAGIVVVAEIVKGRYQARTPTEPTLYANLGPADVQLVEENKLVLRVMPTGKPCDISYVWSVVRENVREGNRVFASVPVESQGGWKSFDEAKEQGRDRLQALERNQNGTKSIPGRSKPDNRPKPVA